MKVAPATEYYVLPVSPCQAPAELSADITSLKRSKLFFHFTDEETDLDPHLADSEPVEVTGRGEQEGAAVGDEVQYMGDFLPEMQGPRNCYPMSPSPVPLPFCPCGLHPGSMLSAAWEHSLPPVLFPSPPSSFLLSPSLPSL